MISIFLPTTYVNETTYDDVVEGKLVRRKRTTQSSTGPISISFSGPLGKSFTKEALEAKKVLTINPGETIEFSDEEGAFLLERYPFLVNKSDNLGGVTVTENPVASTPDAEIVKEVTKLDLSEAPSNYMQLKKWAVERGVDVAPTDKRDTILEKLRQKA